MIDTGLRHVLKKEYVIYYKTSDGRKYLSTIYSTTTNFVNDIDDAMKLKTLEAAKGAYLLASDFNNNELHVSKTETIVEDVNLDSEEEEEDK